jgi:hypothetical protein
MRPRSFICMLCTKSSEGYFLLSSQVMAPAGPSHTPMELFKHLDRELVGAARSSTPYALTLTLIQFERRLMA